MKDRPGGRAIRTTRRARTLGALIAAAVIVPACTGETPPGRDSAAPPAKLFYVDGAELYAYDVANDSRAPIASLPSADVAVAPDGRSFVVVREEGVAGETEGFEDPVLYLGSTTGDATPRRLGSGRAPLWAPSGDDLAAIAPAEGDSICPARPKGSGSPSEKGCVTGEEVVVYPDADAEPSVALGAGRWSIIGWTQGGILGLEALNGRLVVGRPGEASPDADPVPFAPAEVWGISPTEPKLLVYKGDRLFFSSLDELGTTAVDAARRHPGDGTWSPDGSAIALTLVGPRGSELGLVDVATGRVELVPEGRDAHGQVVWDEDGRAFAFVRETAGGRSLEAVLCSIDLECRDLFSWKQGVVLLALA